jgi:hypothetical protein
MTRSDIADQAMLKLARRAERLRTGAVVAAIVTWPFALVGLWAVVARLA